MAALTPRYERGVIRVDHPSQLQAGRSSASRSHEIQFDDKPEKGQRGKVDIAQQTDDMWMRNIQTSPAQLLRRKVRDRSAGAAAMNALAGIILLLSVASPALAAPQPRARVAIEGTQPVPVGQQVRDPKAMKIGDALTRTVETVAANSQAMMIPPPTFAAPDGVRVYPRDPRLSDVTTERGFVGGRRVDRAARRSGFWPDARSAHLTWRSRPTVGRCAL